MRKVLKWIGFVLAGFIGLLVLALVVLNLVTGARMNKTYTIPEEAISIPADQASLERGQHMVQSVNGCGECHGPSLGGKLFFDDPAIGQIYAPNLTSGQGGAASHYNDSDWIRVLRHGVGSDGKPLLIMPAQNYYYLSDEDLGAVIAYLKTIPPVDNESPDPRLTPMARVLFALGALGKMPAELIDHTAPRPNMPPAGATVEYGEYLVNVATCRDCHGVDLNGGQPGPGEPFGPNLTPDGELARWSQTDFVAAIRTGATPDNGRIDPEAMPWPSYGGLSDDELNAVWLYLSSLPAMETASP
jgi:mono/diheme cytochrome c family protein